jgi:hypothetical protein
MGVRKRRNVEAGRGVFTRWHGDMEVWKRVGVRACKRVCPGVCMEA